MLLSIPSPSRGVIELGPLALHAYGLMLALGVVAAAAIAQRRWAARGHDPKEISDIAVPVVVAGVIGARVYHLFTGYDWDDGGIVGAFKIWEGGLSIWGAVGGGLVGVVVMARIKHLDTLAVADAIAPGLAVAQAIGRWGNWFNQELFGRPTKLPWALEIDVDQRPAGYIQYETFHPTFLYESLWALTVAAGIVWAERRWQLRRGQAFALYVAGYTFGRIWFEALRIDEATKVFGVRFNLIVSIVVFAGGVLWFVWLGRHGRVSDSAATPTTESP